MLMLIFAKLSKDPTVRKAVSYESEFIILSHFLYGSQNR